MSKIFLSYHVTQKFKTKIKKDKKKDKKKQKKTKKRQKKIKKNKWIDFDFFLSFFVFCV